jgi:hypothetical protein
MRIGPKEETVPIYFAAEPKNGITLVKKGIRELSKRLNPLADSAADFQISQPYAVYDVRDDDAIAGGFLASATRSGFRYLVTEGGDLVAVAEVHVDNSGAATLLTHINCGPCVEATSHAFGLASLLMPVDAGSYEARLLRYSAIALMALWLKPDAGGPDVFYPLAPAPKGIHTAYSYSTAEFLWAVHSVAQKRATHKRPV